MKTIRLSTLIGALVIAAPAFAGDPGVTDDTIEVGSILPLQSGLSAGASQYRDGIDAYLKWVNKNGGVNGRKIIVHFENDSYNPQQAVAAAKKLVDRDGVFAIVGTLGTTNTVAMIPHLANRGVPLIGPLGSHPSINTPTERIVFPISPLGTSHGISLAKYAAEELGAKTLAVFYQDDQYGKEILQGVEEYAEENGLEVVGEASYVPSDVDVSAQALSLRDTNPDAVVMAVIPKHGALFMLEAQKLGWDAKFLAPQLMSDKVSLDLGGSALNGLIINLYSAHETMDTEAVAEAKEAMAEFAPDTAPGYWPFMGMSGAKLFVTALRNVEGEPTREKLMDALEALGTYDSGIIPPVTYAPEKHAGPTVFGYAEVIDGEKGEVKVLKHWAD
ncbi:ABC transporter substrate-binding protein [Acuticoccus mangrovi]|uniref:ABC transporter substrate-binding protein n=1 Tax=Acuticoccus mangrovi TaxID=2796142 RepID=A0A934MHI0_9HYPH|nr:ABC transporter substrate-binding protein [Acuticoccus mangrovi]